ncbi:MAG: enoyl-CoA hydratase-related protein [Candidatus Sericytochromatia bacterium]
MSESVLIDVQQHVMRVTWNRPEKKNALTGAMYAAFEQALERAATDPDVRVVLVVGAGDAFTAGNDLKDFATWGQSGGIEDIPVIRAIRRVVDFPKPLVAAVKGAAVGFGTTLLAHCDAVVAGQSATFSMPFVRLGLVPEFGSSYLMQAIAGRVVASHKLLLGEPFGRDEAVTMGLVSLACADDALEAEAEALCREAIGWRYRLLPYLYGVFRESAETGLPIMRPMAMAHPAEPAARGLFDQYMLGADLLVAPVTRPQTDRRMVYFPAGRWEDLLTGELHEGPGFRVVPAPLDRIPVFLRGGAALPVGPVRQHTGEPLETLTLRLGPADAWTGTWYDDDGETLAHQSGGYALWRFTGRRDESGLSLDLDLTHDGHHGPTDTVSVEVAWTGPVGAVTFDGAELTDWRLAGDRLTARLPLAPGTLRIT